MKTQMRFQKILMLVTLVVSALCVVYAVCFCTPIADMSALTHAATRYRNSDPINANWTYDACQTVTDVLLWMGVVFVLLVAVLYITASNSRRNYYISNSVAVLGTAAYAVILGILIIVLTAICHYDYYYNVWWNVYEYYADGRSVVYSDNVATWIVGYVLGVIVLANAAALVCNYLWKINLMKGEQALLAGGPVKEVAYAE